MPRSVVAEVLGYIEAASLGFAAARGVARPPLPRLYAVLLLLALAVVSTPWGWGPGLLGLAAGLPLLLRLGGRGAVSWRQLLVVLSFSLIAAAPLPLMGEAPVVAAQFVVRVVSASVLVYVAVASAGWECLGLPGPLVNGVRLLLVNLHVTASEALKVASAVESRSLGAPRGLRDAWLARAGLVAAVLDKAAARAFKVSLAVQARTLTPASTAPRSCRPSRAGVLAYAPPLLVVAAAVVVALS